MVPAVGRYTRAYFDFDGTYLHILNDWQYNDRVSIEPHCYNLFYAWTGGGAEQWILKVYGDARVEVRLNGAPMSGNETGARGASGWGLSPGTPHANHSMFEVRFPVSPGSFGVQLHDPGPTFACDVLEGEPASFTGTANDNGTTVVIGDEGAWEDGVGELPPENYCRDASLMLPRGLSACVGCTPNPAETCFHDERCAACDTDPHGCLGCNAGSASQLCRFCGFGQYAEIPCPSYLTDALSLAENCNELPPVSANATQNDDWEAGLGKTSQSPASGSFHVVDGQFSGWQPGMDGWPAVGRRLAPTTDPYYPGGCASDAAYEWCDIQPAHGRLTYAYFDYNGSHLHVLNDWIYNDARPVLPHCYNLFNAWTGGGEERWLFYVYGDGHVDAWLNGVPVPANASWVEGAVGWGLSPLQEQRNHTIFELSFRAMPGGFGVQLKDPGPRYGCEVLEEDPAPIIGNMSDDGGGVIITPVPRQNWTAPPLPPPPLPPYDPPPPPPPPPPASSFSSPPSPSPSACGSRTTL